MYLLVDPPARPVHSRLTPPCPPIFPFVRFRHILAQGRTAMTASPNAPHPISIDKIEKEKQAAARAALGWVRNGMTLGLGTGTTARYFIQFLGERLRSEPCEIEAVASSTASEEQARDLGMRVISPRRGLRLDL